MDATNAATRGAWHRLRVLLPLKSINLQNDNGRMQPSVTVTYPAPKVLSKSSSASDASKAELKSSVVGTESHAVRTSATVRNILAKILIGDVE